MTAPPPSKYVAMAVKITDEWMNTARHQQDGLVDLEQFIARALHRAAVEANEAAARVVERAEREKWGSFKAGTKLLVPFLPEIAQMIRALLAPAEDGGAGG
jgi:hypothetical protein